MYIDNICKGLDSINKSVILMVKGQIYFGLSKSLAKVEIYLFCFCFRLKVILHLSFLDRNNIKLKFIL